MNKKLLSVFALSILALAVGGVSVVVPSLSPAALALLLFLSALFPLLSRFGKALLLASGITGTLLLIARTIGRIPLLQLPIILLLLLSFSLSLSLRPSFPVHDEFFSALLLLFFAIGLVSLFPFRGKSPLQGQAAGILLSVMALGGIALTASGEMEEGTGRDFAIIPFLLFSLWVLQKPWIVVGYAAGTIGGRKGPRWLPFLSPACVPLLFLSPLAALPLGFFLSLLPSPRLFSRLLLSLLPFLPPSPWTLLPACLLASTGSLARGAVKPPRWRAG